MKIAAWVLFIIALSAFGVTWLIGEQKKATALNNERYATATVENNLKALQESKRLDDSRLNGSLTTLNTQIADYEADISKSKDRIAEARTQTEAAAIPSQDLQARADMIAEIKTRKREIEQLKRELNEVRGN